MSRMKERMRSGELYRADDPALNAELSRRQGLLHALNALSNETTDERRRALEGLLGGIGTNVQVRSPFVCDFGDGIEIGEDSFVNAGCTMLDCAEIVLGRSCLLASGVQLVTATHPIDPVARREAWEMAYPIVLADGVWIGAGAVVCPGVSIGENSVVGAGAVVTRDVPAGVVAYGNPARPIREIGESDRIETPPL